MKAIPKSDFEKLRKMGKIKEAKKNQDANFYIANKTHPKAKTYYVQEPLLKFLD